MSFGWIFQWIDVTAWNWICLAWPSYHMHDIWYDILNYLIGSIKFMGVCSLSFYACLNESDILMQHEGLQRRVKICHTLVMIWGQKEFKVFLFFLFVPMDFYCLANLTKNYAKNVMEAFYMTSHMHIFCVWNQIDVKQSLTYTAVLFCTCTMMIDMIMSSRNSMYILSLFDFMVRLFQWLSRMNWWY